MRDLVIIGAGGFGREASLLVEDINEGAAAGVRWNLLGFIDRDEAKWGQVLRGYPVLGGWEALAGVPAGAALVCVLGDPRDKQRIVERAAGEKREFASLVHPGVRLDDTVRIGRGVLINRGCLLTVDIEIGDHVSINPGCGIGHDAVVGEYSTLMWRVNLSGAVKVGQGCMLGSGAVVLQGKRIGSWARVGAGAVVTADLPPACTAVGVPARVVKPGRPVERGEIK